MSIIESIDNFAEVKASPDTWFKGSYSLATFLGVNGRKPMFERFLSENYSRFEYGIKEEVKPIVKSKEQLKKEEEEYNKMAKEVEKQQEKYFGELQQL